MGHALFCKNMRVGHTKLAFVKMNFSSPPPPVLYDQSLISFERKEELVLACVLGARKEKLERSGIASSLDFPLRALTLSCALATQAKLVQKLEEELSSRHFAQPRLTAPGSPKLVRRILRSKLRVVGFETSVLDEFSAY